MSEIRTCIRGCIRRRRHIECVDDTCRGCEPRTAARGLLCDPCYDRLRLMIEQAEIAERWLTGNLPKGMAAAQTRQDFERRGGSDGPPAPVSLAIFDVRELLRDRFASWVDNLCEHSGLKGPTTHGVVEDSKFLMAWFGEVVKLDWIGDWFEEMAVTMSDAHSLAPWRPEMGRLRGIPCPDCHMPALVIFGGESMVSCLECRSIMSQDRYGLWTRILAEENSTEVAG